MASTRQPVLVLGGTGTIGRRVVERLTARGLPVRIGSRSGEPRFDWEDRATWEPVLEGVGSAYVSHHFDAIPGAAETLGSFAELAVESGVPRLVLLSAGDTPEPFVDAEDIADVAVSALTDDRHIGEVYELTGPRLLTSAEAVQEISGAVGREIGYVPISIEDFAAASAEQGVPSEVVEMLTYIFGEVLDGRNAHLADGVQRALGREPRDFRDYAREAAASGVWNASPVTA